MLKKKHIREYQKRGIKFIRNEDQSFVISDMGTGKTLMTQTAFKKKFGPALVIAPPPVAKNVWHKESNNWKHLKDLKVIPVVGTIKKREKLISEPADIYVLSCDTEILTWFVRFCNKKKKFPYKWIIIDESSFYKDHSTQRSKIVRQIASYAKKVTMLTGTPMSNGYQDYFGQFLVLDGGETFGPSYDKFLRTYFNKDRFNRPYIKSEEHGQEILDLVAKKSIRFDINEYVEVPPIVENRHYINLPPYATSKYKELAREFFLEFPEGEVDVQNQLVMAGKLLQMASGTVYLNKERESYAKIHREKLDYLLEMLKGINASVLIMYNFIPDREQILDEVKGSVHFAGQPNLEERWNRQEKHERYVCNPMSMSHGLNLQHGGNHMIFYSLGWSNEQHRQAIGRIHRSGQKNKCFIDYLLAANTGEDVLFKKLKNKQLTQVQSLAYIRDNLKQFLN